MASFEAMEKYSCWGFVKVNRFPRVWEEIRKETGQCPNFQLLAVNLLYAEFNMCWSCCSCIDALRANGET